MIFQKKLKKNLKKERKEKDLQAKDRALDIDFTLQCFQMLLVLWLYVIWVNKFLSVSYVFDVKLIKYLLHLN